MKTTSTTAPSAHPLPELTKLKINGVSPFWSHADGVTERLCEAWAILTMLADRHDVIGEDAESGDIRHEVQSRALEGVKTLLALAVYHSDCTSSERPSGEGV